MSKATVRIRYDGPALARHQMDVADLAPALLGLSELCKIANQRFNADRAAVKVLVRIDVKQNCFEFDLTLVQTIWQQAQALLEHREVRSAKEILEWLGIVSAAGGGALGLFRLVKWLKGREPSDANFVIQHDGNTVRVSVNGDNNQVMVVQNEAWELAKQPSAIRDVQRVVAPLTKQGYEELEFRKGSKVTERITRADAETIMQLATGGARNEQPIDDPQSITAWISVYSPVYDEDATTWRFKYGDYHPWMDISETDIAKRALERGGALSDDRYKVRLEIQQVVDGNGKEHLRYKIKEVLDFHPATIFVQKDWVDDGGDDSEG